MKILFQSSSLIYSTAMRSIARLSRYVFFSALFFASCSSILPTKPEPATQITLIRVSESYVNNIIKAQDQALESMVLWTDYLHSKNPPVQKEEILSDIHRLQGVWTAEDHPLLHLDLARDITMRGDSATVAFRRVDKPQSPILEIELLWVGRGWLIQRDNMLGPNGVLTKLEQQKIQENQ